jgi:hypothetical protein
MNKNKFDPGQPESNQRRQSRTKAVLPVRVRGKDSSGTMFEELVHTLDVTFTGARLGAVRHELQVPEQLTILYRQRRMEFRVVWTKKLKGLSEYQVGLEAVTADQEGWGLSATETKIRNSFTAAPAAASPGAQNVVAQL